MKCKQMIKSQNTNKQKNNSVEVERFYCNHDSNSHAIFGHFTKNFPMKSGQIRWDFDSFPADWFSNNFEIVNGLRANKNSKWQTHKHSFVDVIVVFAVVQLNVIEWKKTYSLLRKYDAFVRCNKHNVNISMFKKKPVNDPKTRNSFWIDKHQLSVFGVRMNNV